MTSVPEANIAGGLAWLVAGAGGMLGTALQRVIAERGEVLCAPLERDFDITDPAAVHSVIAAFVEQLAPGTRGMLVNAAAFTNVEAAEDNVDVARRVNTDGPAILARAARAAGLGFVHVSTDFVFDGRKGDAYTEADATNPLSVYGVTKLAGEVAVARECADSLTVRTAWVFGPGGTNFPTKILEAAKTRPALSVVTDEVGSPTFTVDLARGILALVAVGARGTYHLAGSGSCSRFELAEEVLRLAGVDTPIEPVTSGAFTMRASRPLNSVLDCSKAAAFGVHMPNWRDSLCRFMDETAGF